MFSARCLISLFYSFLFHFILTRNAWFGMLPPQKVTSTLCLSEDGANSKFLLWMKNGGLHKLEGFHGVNSLGKISSTSWSTACQFTCTCADWRTRNRAYREKSKIQISCPWNQSSFSRGQTFLLFSILLLCLRIYSWSALTFWPPRSPPHCHPFALSW